MFCPNCGNKLNENEDFCPKCGNRVTKLDNIPNDSSSTQQNLPTNTSNEQTMSEKLSKNSEKFFKLLMDKLKKFIAKYKKQEMMVAVCLLLFFIGVFAYGQLFGFEKLSWNEEYPDYFLNYVTQTKVKLGINFSNDEKIKDIKYSSNCGKVENNGLELNWDLTKNTGKCKITVSYKNKKLTKEFSVIPFDISESELALDYEVDLSSDEDLDLDGLTNKQEKEYKTSPILSDTDMDGLDDNYEILTSKTDPTKKDTDGDGLSDYDEIELGLDPLKADSKDDGIRDGDRILTYTYNTDGLKVSIEGKGNIASTTVQIHSGTKISNKLGLIDNLFTFHSSGTINKAVVTIPYTDEELVENNLNEDNLSIYYYNEKDNKYEKINTIIDKENNTLTATLSHFSHYVIGDSSLVEETSTTQILFILDNSWSMYTNEQYKKITGEEYTGSLFGSSILDGTDADGLRFTLTSDLVTKFASKNYQIGLSEFRQDYASAVEIGTNYDTIKSKLSEMFGNFITEYAGTYIGNALTKGISQFSDDADNKYIIILTDGEDTSYSDFTLKVIEEANKNDVKICSIGFSSGSNSSTLSSISNGTGCKYYASSDVSGLTELFDNLETEINDDLVDIDDDGETDGILLADSEFIVNRDGFSFNNYGTNLSSGGHCFGMATFAELYYKKVLPLSLDSKTVEGDTSYAYNLNDTYFKNYANLYDYKLQTNALKYTFGFDIFGEEKPSDLRTVDGTKLTFTDKYKKEISDSGIYDLSEEKTGLSKKEQIERWGANYKTSDVLYLNEDKMQSSNSMENDDLQMLNAIYASFIKQNATTFYSSGSDFILWLRNVLGTESDRYPDAEGFINILKSRLEDGDAPVISSSFSGGLHAINAISLTQDIDNPNYYYVGVYDNNYPGEKRYVDIECTKNTCATVANDYYENSNEPIRITPSIEYDLEYYK